MLPTLFQTLAFLDCSAVITAFLAGLLLPVLIRIFTRCFASGNRDSSATGRSLQARLLEAQQIAGVGSWDWDSITGAVWWSDQNYQLFGVSKSSFIPTYDNYLSMVHPDDRESVRRRVADVLAAENTYVHDYRIIRPDGVVLWVQSRGVTTRDPAGKLIRMTGTDQAITDRKLAENALRTSEDLFQAIFDQAFQFIGLMSTDGTLERANRTAMEAGGYPPAEVLGKPFWETPWWAHDPVQQLRLRDAVKRAASGETVRFEATHPLPDGAELCVDFSLKPYRDESGVIRWLIPEGRDITERKKVEQELRKSRERFEAAVSGSQDGLWDWDVVTGDVYYSPRWKSMLGYADNELNNEFAVWESLLHPDDRRMATKSLDDYFRGHLPTFEIEVRMRAKSGDWRWILSRGTATRDESGRPIRLAGSHTDVTDRRLAADELAANKALLNLFVKHSPAAIAMLDTEMRYVLTSDQYLNDYRLTDRNIIGRSHYDVFPDIPDRWKEIHQRVLRGAVESCAEDPFPRADGSVDWLQWEVRPWLGPDGEIGGVIFFTQVITERKRVEAAMRESDARLSLTLQMAGAATWYFDLETQEFHPSESAIQMHGLPPEANIDHARAMECIHEADRDRVAEALTRSVEENQPFRVEYRVRMPFGDVRWLSSSADLHPGPKGLRLLGLLQDITEQKHAEHALRESEERYRSVVESLAEGIVVQDLSGEIIACNSRAESILGLTRDQIAGRTSLDPRWSAIHEDGSPFPGNEHPSMVALRTGRPVFNTIMGIRKPGGELAWIVINVIPFRQSMPGSDGGRAVVCSFHDVTDARHMNERLRASLREKEVMLQEIHHRVKNNLAITIGLFNFQIRELGAGPACDALGEARDRVRTMALVHEMLYQAPSLADVDLPGYVGQLVRHLAAGYSAGERVSVVLDVFPAALPLAAAIPFGLILNEVVSNAFKYAFPAPHGGTLRVSVRPEEDRLILEVCDDGFGMPPGVNPFETRSLGLRLVRELASQLDGTVEMIRNQGTTFRLNLPRHSEVEV